MVRTLKLFKRRREEDKMTKMRKPRTKKKIIKEDSEDDKNKIEVIKIRMGQIRLLPYVCHNIILHYKND